MLSQLGSRARGRELEVNPAKWACRTKGIGADAASARHMIRQLLLLHPLADAFCLAGMGSH
jgi:hypothetical protein